MIPSVPEIARALTGASRRQARKSGNAPSGAQIGKRAVERADRGARPVMIPSSVEIARALTGASRRQARKSRNAPSNAPIGERVRS